ncbi:MAG: DUF1499 domain-containing protein [Betaproteobacteria bacterium]|nr:DUF1499 domain-containing protein [Betaproteobacteria bacterium]
MLKWIVIVVALLVLLPLLAGRLGWLHGPAPTRLGVVDGRLKPPSSTPNSVSSQADLWPGHRQREVARIDPFAAGAAAGGADAAWARLQRVVAAAPGARIVRVEGDYLYAQFTTRWLGFMDDVEFWLDRRAGVIHVRSASRLGRRDFGVNRARVEALRAEVARAGAGG